jgi:hypothetical protein
VQHEVYNLSVYFYMVLSRIWPLLGNGFLFSPPAVIKGVHSWIQDIRDQTRGIDPMWRQGRIHPPYPSSHRRRRKGKSRILDSKIWSRVPRDSDMRMTALARSSSNCIWQTHPLIQREHSTTTNLQLSDSNKNLVISLRWVLYSKTDRPTDHRS